MKKNRPKVLVRTIIEMLGSPKEHIAKTIRDYVEKLEKEDYATVISKEFSKPKKTREMYSVYVEIEMETHGIENLVWFCFDYMPSSIEILEPSSIEYSAHDFTDFINDLQARLHKFDMLLKNLNAENKVIKKNGLTLAKNMILVGLKEGPKDIETLKSVSGIPVKQLEKFLKTMVDEKRIIVNKKVYSLP